MTPPSLILIQQRYKLYARKPHGRCWRSPADAHTRSGQEDAKPTIQDYEFCVIILFFPVLPFVLTDIRIIEDPYAARTHSDVSTISTCFSVCYDLLPTPPPISVRKAGGITVVYLCGF